MLIVNYNKEILDDVHRIHNGSFPFPDFNDSTFIEKKIIIDKGKVIGCGIIKITSEFILILDEQSSIKSRVLGLQELQKHLVCDLLKKGIRDCHIFTDSDNVTKFAEHCGFEKCPSKDVLSLRFGY